MSQTPSRNQGPCIGITPGSLIKREKTHTKTATPDRLCPRIIESMVKEPAGGFLIPRGRLAKGNPVTCIEARKYSNIFICCTMVYKHKTG